MVNCVFCWWRGIGRFVVGVVLAAGLELAGVAGVAVAAMPEPDEVVMRDGRVLRGLILENTARQVVLQTQGGQERIDKKQVVRIREEKGLLARLADMTGKGLPGWRVVVNDLRTLDGVRSLFAIPPVRIEEGDFRAVPYVSFVLNGAVELNIYGDPDEPAGIEMGLFGPRRDVMRERQQVREYLAGFLGSRAELAALYGLDLRGGRAKAGDVVIEATNPDEPDAEGTWWLAIYDPVKLERARVPWERYAKMTIPAEEARRVSGRNPRRGLDEELAGWVLRLWELSDLSMDAVAEQMRPTLEAGAGLAVGALGTSAGGVDGVVGFVRDRRGKITWTQFETGSARPVVERGGAPRKGR